MKNDGEIIAWRTEAIGIASIVWSRSRAQARYATTRSARDAGWDVRFTQVRAHRAPSFDGLQGAFAERRCYSLDYIRAVLNAPSKE